jgi:steroid delta-isomerase-like uncharacterized protein
MMSQAEMQRVAHRWFDAVNTGNLNALDEIVAEDVIDHSGLSRAHGYGRTGHKALAKQLHNSFPGWQWHVNEMAVKDDLVLIEHVGKGQPPVGMQGLLGNLSNDTAELNQVEFRIKNCVRVRDGKIVEHWAMDSPLGKNSAPAAWSEPGDWPSDPAPSESPTQRNKQFMQRYVRYVIDGQNPALAANYFAPNFYNHDRAPGEQLGLDGVTAFLQSIFGAFTGFQTTIEEQVAESDLVLGRWSQTFTNTGPYLSFPASGKTVHITGMTITRVRDGRIVEEWEGRDAIGLLVQMGVIQPLGPLEGSPGSSAGASMDGNEAVARHFVYEAWNAGNVAVVDELFSSDFVNHSQLAGQASGRGGLKQLIRGWRSGFPDMSVRVDLALGEGDKVALRWTLNGTHRGTFLGISPTGKSVTLPGITLFRVQRGKITESWEHWEQAGMLGQLGIVQFPDYPASGPTTPSNSPGLPTRPSPNW